MSAPADAVSSATLRGLRDALGRLDPDIDAAERIDRIRLLEEIKSAAAAAQAEQTAAFALQQQTEQRESGTREELVGRGVAAQVALARRTSPWQAQRYVGWATILTSELPGTFAELRAGRTTEWRAMIVARESATLSREHRALLDADLAPRLEQLGDRRVEAEARKIAYQLDPAGYVDRIRQAEADRLVALRQAPDVMSRLTGVLPVAQGVAAYAALRQHADSLLASGDERTRSQIMADTLVERVTGQVCAADVPVEINLVMSEQTFRGDDEPVHLDGYGPIPAGTARDLIRRTDASTPMWLRRLYARPDDGRLIAMDSHRRTFTPAQQRFVRFRDQVCRTPWCEAPVRHIDHVVGVEHGGRTSVENAQGLCASCNYAKQAHGWHSRPSPDGDIVITTPTGHDYVARVPAPPGSPVERRLRSLLDAA